MSTEPPTDPSSESTQPTTQQDATQPSTTSTDPQTQHYLSNTSSSMPLESQDHDRLPNEEADLDAEIEPNEPHPHPPSDPMNMDGASDTLPPTQQTTAPAGGETNGLPTHHPAVIEPRIPQKKDTSLREFLGKMDDYAPLIPDAVTDYYLTLSGLPPPPETDRRLARLLALATQKFIADVAADAYQYSRIRSTNTTSNNPLTGLGGAAGFGMNVPAGGAGGEGAEGGAAGKGGKKDTQGKSAPLGGPRAGYGGGGAGGGGQGRTVLTMEDLGMAVGEYGVNVKRGEFYR